MLSSFRVIVMAAAALIAATAYSRFGALFGAGVLALLGLAALCARWLKSRRAQGAGLHDPGVSTLVFPPESKFHQSVLPPR
jgi:hypothetical protein